MLWNATLAALVLSGVLALVLGMRIEKHYPGLRAAVDDPSLGWWPFWVFHFVSPSKLRMLSRGDSMVAVASLSLLGFAVGALAYFVYRFIHSGATL